MVDADEHPSKIFFRGPYEIQNSIEAGGEPPGNGTTGSLCDVHAAPPHIYAFTTHRDAGASDPYPDAH